MPKLGAEERLERARQAKVKAEADMRAAAADLRARDRRADTRRKVLLGGALIALAKQDQRYAEFALKLISKMPERERAAFEGWQIGGDMSPAKPVPK